MGSIKREKFVRRVENQPRGAFFSRDKLPGKKANFALIIYKRSLHILYIRGCVRNVSV